MSWRAHLERADRYLQSAELLLEDGDHASSVSRSYYAMFHAAQAALLTEGIDAGSHRGVISMFGERFVKEGPLDPEMGRSLSRAFRERSVGEYEPTEPVPAETARNLIGEARAFVRRVEAELDRASG